MPDYQYCREGTSRAKCLVKLPPSVLTVMDSDILGGDVCLLLLPLLSAALSKQQRYNLK